ncbi:uncharacterized protein C8A04DRAFT_13784 [Dichotomopilus funicola]|uniref:BZIP domain-containing protein n=1 Tax=Dichotomopilus funicola TaxID=1934379 RepID=A0AAN6V1F7_9PEZI|nr:hypothetical protein C8A04DRAFT_13784 [Dichotomopilus funicola]
MKPDSYRTRVHKFSCKPPGHDAARQRENQRRHRARVKGRITELEALLLTAQSKLHDACNRIEELTAQVQRLQHTAGAITAMPITAISRAATDLDRSPFHAGDTNRVPELVPYTLDVFPRTSSLSPEANPPTTVKRPGSTNSPTLPNPAVPNPHVTNPVGAVFEDPNDDYPDLPPPQPNESTIPCREAYAIIKDRLSAPEEFDLSTATDWMEPGFRRAVVPGAGCRVQTHVLFAFVDRITPI